MGSLSMMEAKRPLGFRFHPRDEELISDYLARKVSGDGSGFPAMMVDVNLSKCEPWNLPEMACVGGKVWYFYSQRCQKYAFGHRTNRATTSGYWKTSGKDQSVIDPRLRQVVGKRKTLVFYLGRASKVTKTGWIMHEFRMERSVTSVSANLSFKDDWVLCRVFHKSKGLPLKPSTDSSHDDAGPSSLPPHLDRFISFEQAQLSLKGYEQLPYFSSTHPPPLGLQPQPHYSTTASHDLTVEGNMPEMGNSFTCLLGMPDLTSYVNSVLRNDGREGSPGFTHMRNHPF